MTPASGHTCNGSSGILFASVRCREDPLAFNRYIEPFVGSGAVFFDLFGAGRLRGHRARLVDLNPDLNRDGEFNVPAGRYTRPRVCDPEHVRDVARALAADGVAIECLPFDETLAGAGDGDFVYCDPPYVPLSRTANFAHYTAGGFTAADHGRLLQAVLGAAGRGAMVLVSNSSAPEVEAAYSGQAARQAGLIVERVPARRAINSRASVRGPVDELVITNSPTARSRAGATARMLTARPPAARRRPA